MSILTQIFSSGATELVKGIGGVIDNLHTSKEEKMSAELKVKEDRVQELKTWKDKMDEVISPTQLKNALIELDDLKLYKTKAITVFAVVQFMMATALALSKFY